MRKIQTQCSKHFYQLFKNNQKIKNLLIYQTSNNSINLPSKFGLKIQSDNENSYKKIDFEIIFIFI